MFAEISVTSAASYPREVRPTWRWTCWHQWSMVCAVQRLDARNIAKLLVTSVYFYDVFTFAFITSPLCGWQIETINDLLTLWLLGKRWRCCPRAMDWMSLNNACYRCWPRTRRSRHLAIFLNGSHQIQSLLSLGHLPMITWYRWTERERLNLLW